MAQHADTRMEKAAASRDRWAAAARKHREREARARARGKTAAAEMARKAAETAEAHARANARKVEALEVPAARARVARRVNEDSAETILARAVAEAEATPFPIRLDPKEERRQSRASEKLAQQERQTEERARSELRRVGLDHDPRTAAAQREVIITGGRGATEKRAMVAGYASLIRTASDRTGPRIEGMRRFDELCHRAYAGLFPNPKFERGVDISKGLPGVPDDRCDGLAEMDRLSARIGEEAKAILFFRIFEARTFTAMRDMGLGGERELAVLFLRAVDAVARFYGLSERPSAVEAMESRIAAA
ncbi:hypothetical protein [Methylobacterium sp. PvR107]|uniref:hypothetical protein n=1 Tax=Methylobacterium sp. PvR107 TaxID=2806597 RepID=UPI001AE465D4|nr:hypothetical protein [Methylobacterium sp. PvR107]MBP1180005.1 hypothetical protein [Methylobacterium sp. PvR107]